MSHEEFKQRQLEQGKQMSPLFATPGFSTKTFKRDWLHIVDQGVGGRLHWQLLHKGTKAAGLGLIRVLTILGHVFNYQAMLLSVFRYQIPRRLPPPDLGLEIRYFSKNPIDFKPRQKKTEKRFPKQKRQKSSLEVIKNDFSEKSMFAIPSLRQPRFWSPQHRNSGSEVDQKKMAWKQVRDE